MYSKPKVSAVLTRYKRLQELEQIIENLKQYDFIDEILICNNTKDNLMSWARYEKMHLAKNDTIYLQDDDCIIENLRELYDYYDGTKLINGFKKERMQLYPGKDTMLGWGAFLDRRWTYIPMSKYIGTYGKDRILFREADRIFTVLMEMPKLTIPVIVRDFPSAMASFALSLQPDHEITKAMALKRCEAISRSKTVAA